jgi:protein-S-isoprenylcysteine O-methyltransferase Ste14
MDVRFVLIVIWIGWLFSWVVAAGWSRKTVKAPSAAREIPYRLVQGVGLAMVFMSIGGLSGRPLPPNAPPVVSTLFAPLWVLPSAGAWIAIALCAAGFAFAWWARLHLGTLWSSSVTRKEDHRIVDTGPYGIVRHPIYTGMLMGAIALVVASGTTLALIGFAVFVVGILMKARLEERFLSGELGVEAYESYRRRVPMLVPFAGP